MKLQFSGVLDIHHAELILINGWDIMKEVRNSFSPGSYLKTTINRGNYKKECVIKWDDTLFLLNQLGTFNRKNIQLTINDEKNDKKDEELQIIDDYHI